LFLFRKEKIYKKKNKEKLKQKQEKKKLSEEKEEVLFGKCERLEVNKCLVV
jgi:hypothetical protein